MELNIPFPFQPYAIQEKFMKELYLTLEQRRLGIFESPTGTGKSLSMCCGALQWLKDSEYKVQQAIEAEISQIRADVSDSQSSEDWLTEEYEKIKKNSNLALLRGKLEKILKKKESFQVMKSRVTQTKQNIKHLAMMDSGNLNAFQKKTVGNGEEDGDKEREKLVDDDLILDESDDKLDDEFDSDGNESEEEDSVKIYISSRTHSQLAQFIGELKKTVFGSDTRVVTIASRQHFCINCDVAKLKNVNLINERCLDMQKAKTKSTSVGEDGKVLKKTKTKACTSCPYYNQSNIIRLKERMLVDIVDMEDLVKAGKELKGCPYYASRAAISDAQVVLVSHAGIVSSGARSGVSLKLKNNVLLLDEAHGLSAALEQAHSAPLSARQLTSVKTYLQFYINRYRAKLSSRNLLSLNQIAFVVSKLLGMVNPMTCLSKKGSEETTIFTLEGFTIKAEIDHLNLRPLIEFCRNTRLAPKLHGFSMRYRAQVLEEELRRDAAPKKSTLEVFLKGMSKKTSPVQVTEENKPVLKIASDLLQFQGELSAGSSLYAVLSFLEMLCDRSENGRVLAQRSALCAQLKYLLLNPAEHFSDVVKQCRSVIVAGGTMEPISEFQTLLTGNTAGDSNSRVTVVRCEHVVSPENVLAVCLCKGPTNLPLNFSYESRQSNDLMDEIGRILRNVCNLVPGGVVCFLPSYSYEQKVYDHLKLTNAIEHTSRKKKIFREPKSAAQVDQVLSEYAHAVKSRQGGNTGALLFSVVGGKLSEGLNFSDDLGRCIMVVGMPYPNIKSPELQEKMNYLNRTLGGSAGNLHYENLCMKAVNQCIGRAVRHANDYACVLLLDERYSRPNTIAALPSFVQKSLHANATFGSTIGSVAKFFVKHKQ